MKEVGDMLVKKLEGMLAACLILIFCAGCGVADNDNGRAYKAFYEPLSMELPELQAGQARLCCYADTKSAVFAVGDRNGKQVGPLYDTQYLYVWDRDGVGKVYPLNTAAYVISAIPYGGGVLYVDYAVNSDGVHNWELILFRGEEKVTLAAGTVKDFDRVPKLFFLKEKAVYLWEDDTSFGLNLIEEETVRTLWRETEGTLVSVNGACGNGEVFCVPVSFEGESWATMCVADVHGVLWEKPLFGGITSFAINDTYAVCGTGEKNAEGTPEFTIERVSTSENTSGTAAVKSALWRLCGSGTSFVCVDDHFCIWGIHAETGEAVELAMPPEVPTYRNWPVLFFPLGENSYMVQISVEEEQLFYRMTVEKDDPGSP